MLEAKVKADVLKNMVNSIAVLADEAKLNVSPDGINARCVDPAHVAMVNIDLFSSAFEEYKAEECELGVDLEKLKDILRLAKGEDIVYVRHEEDKNRLIITVGNLTRRMMLVDTSGMSDPNVPSLDFEAKVVLNMNDLQQIIKAAENVSDNITFVCTPEGFEAVSKGETDTVDLKLPKELLNVHECKDKVSSMYPLEYLLNMIKAIKSDFITLHLSTNYPLKLEFDIGDGAGHGEYLLAPRIEEH